MDYKPDFGRTASIHDSDIPWCITKKQTIE